MQIIYKTKTKTKSCSPCCVKNALVIIVIGIPWQWQRMWKK